MSWSLCPVRARFVNSFVSRTEPVSRHLPNNLRPHYFYGRTASAQRRPNSRTRVTGLTCPYFRRAPNNTEIMHVLPLWQFSMPLDLCQLTACAQHKPQLSQHDSSSKHVGSGRLYRDTQQWNRRSAVNSTRHRNICTTFPAHAPALADKRRRGKSR
jgi:hypothetical protein